MRDSGLVTEIAPTGLVKILPVIDGACLSCTVTGCAKRGKPFFVTNPHNISLHVGSHVKVSESKKHQAIQTIVNVFIPIALAIVAYIFMDSTNASDGAKAGFSLLTLFVTCLILFFISTKRKLIQSEIVDIVENAPPSK